MVDYIVVGAGSAGCVLANRLSADPGIKVLLLEAGPTDQKLEIKIPAAFAKLFKTERDWAYETDPDPGAGGRRHFWPRGRTLGGSSSINAMIYIRGNRRDFDAWAARGNRGWRYADVLPYFKRAENQARGGDAFHGTGGPLDVADLVQPNLLTIAFVEAMGELGVPPNPDFNATEQDGAGIYQVTQRRGRRASAATAYLAPAMRRPNLKVKTGARVNRIVFDNCRATGVVVARGPREETISARRGVILCGGAINSPQALMLSGIGHADQLREMKIDPILDAPGVGQNLQDHIVCGAIFNCLEPVTLDSAETIPNLLRFIFAGAGPLTSNVAEGGAFVRSLPDLEQPDVQFHFAPAFFIDHGFANPKGRAGFSIGPTLIRPKSRGAITLRSANPGAPPRIVANYFADPADMATLIRGLKLARDTGHARAFAPFRGDEYLPGPAITDDEGWAAHARNYGQTLYHPAGTCLMGADTLAVVDDQLRVLGIGGLWVVDASIMPDVVAGNTNAAVIMIAEKAADLISAGH